MFAELDTPSVLVDLERLENNIARMAKLTQEAGVQLRPMIKTHKSPEIAKMQLEAGAIGVLAAKLGEAEVMARAGISNITVAVPLIGSQKVERFFRLSREYDVELSATVDSFEAAETLSEGAQKAEVTARYMAKVDIGQGRLGVPAGQPVVEFVQSLQHLPNLTFYGIGTHAAHAYRSPSYEKIEEIGLLEGQLMAETRQLLEEVAIPCPVVAVGSTPTATVSSRVRGVTEIRPGNYVFNDAVQVALGVASPEECALTILTTVISRPTPTRAVIDAGSKALSIDRGPRNIEIVKGYGQVVGYLEIIVATPSEEWTVLTIPEDSSIRVGDRLQILPNHACSVVNLTDTLIGVRGKRCEREIPVAARGCVQ